MSLHYKNFFKICRGTGVLKTIVTYGSSGVVIDAAGPVGDGVGLLKRFDVVGQSRGKQGEDLGELQHHVFKLVSPYSPDCL